MTLRILPRDEWPKLAGTELEAVWPHLPETACVVVVEDNDRIVGCWAIYRLVHCEGAWIDPEYRGNPRVVRRLISGMANVAQAMGGHTVLTAALTEDVATMIGKLNGQELPGRHFVIPLHARKD